MINDRDRDVATFFRVLQRHYQAFMDMLKWQLTSRAEFERLRAQDGDTLTDLERAARFLYLQRLSFGGKVAGRSFGVDTTGPARFDTKRLAPLLEAIHERLAGVTMEPGLARLYRAVGQTLRAVLSRPAISRHGGVLHGQVPREDHEGVGRRF